MSNGHRSSISTGLRMIFGVRPHIDRRSHPVRHVVERRDRADVPDVAFTETGIAQPVAIGDADQMRRLGQLDREVEHGAMPDRQGRCPVVHHHQLAQHRIAGELAHGRAMRSQAVIAAVHAGDRDRDHLALELRQARRRQHQVVVERRESGELGVVMGVSSEHVRHEAELLCAFVEIGPVLVRQRPRLQRQRHHLRRVVLASGLLAHLRLVTLGRHGSSGPRSCEMSF